MHILALDLAGRLGWARWKPGMTDPAYGTARLPVKSRGQTFAAFRDWLTDKCLADRIEHIALEAVFVAPGRESALERLYGLKGIAEEVAFRRNIEVVTVNQGEWRKRFMGVVKAPASIREKADRREWLKQKAKDQCTARGWSVTTSDEADALGILVFERSRLFPEWGAEGTLFGYQPIGA